MAKAKPKPGRFEVDWTTDDGFAGGDRPQHCTIDAGDFDPDADEQRLEELYWEAVQEDFAQKVHAVGRNLPEFLAWAKAMQAKQQEQQ